jgi:hypothetical protein
MLESEASRSTYISHTNIQLYCMKTRIDYCNVDVFHDQVYIKMKVFCLARKTTPCMCSKNIAYGKLPWIVQNMNEYI